MLVLRSFCLFAVIQILLFAPDLYAVQAPYLISCNPVNDSSISLSWRNNSAETNEFVILRKEDSLSGFTAVDTVYDVTDYSDAGLTASTCYYYALIAVGSGLNSDTSNIKSATTLNIAEIVKPSLFELTWRPDSSLIRINFYDSSNCEDSIVVFRGTNLGELKKIYTYIPDDPKGMGIRTYKDEVSSTDYNKWFTYKTCVYKNTDTVAYQENLFALKSSGYTDSLKLITLGEKIGEIPVRYKGWAMKVNDTVFITESNAPESSISIINISNPEEPRFEGYLVSQDPELTVKNKIFTYYESCPNYLVSENNIFTCSDQYLNYYKFENGNFNKIDSLSGKLNLFSNAFLNDSTFLLTTTTTGNDIITCNIFSFKNDKLVYLSDNGKLNFAADIARWWMVFDNKVFLRSEYGNGRCPSPGFIFTDYSFGYNTPLQVTLRNSTNNSYEFNLNKENCSSYLREIDMLSSKYIYKNYYLNTNGLEANNIFLDTVNQTATIITDSLLSIYSFTSSAVKYKVSKKFITSTELISVGRGNYCIRSKECIRNVFVYNPQGRIIKKLSGNLQNSIKVDMRSYGKGIYIISCRFKNAEMINYKVIR